MVGARHGERKPTRTTQRNGHRLKLLSTPAGDIEVGIPKLRTGSFFPELLEPRWRIDKALWTVIMTAYNTGTSSRKVRPGQGPGLRHCVSKSSVSRICKGSGPHSAARTHAAGTSECQNAVAWMRLSSGSPQPAVAVSVGVEMRSRDGDAIATSSGR
ncbi:MAG: transposase [Acidimicrobiia bacterium]